MPKGPTLIVDRADGKLVIAIESNTCNAWVGLNPPEAVALMQAIQKQIEALRGNSSNIVRLDS